MRKLKFSRVPWSVSSGGGPSPGQLGPFCALSSKCFSPHRSVLEALSQETLLKPPDLQSSYSSLSKKKKKAAECGKELWERYDTCPHILTHAHWGTGGKPAEAKVTRSRLAHQLATMVVFWGPKFTAGLQSLNCSLPNKDIYQSASNTGWDGLTLLLSLQASHSCPFTLWPQGEWQHHSVTLLLPLLLFDVAKSMLGCHGRCATDIHPARFPRLSRAKESAEVKVVSEVLPIALATLKLLKLQKNTLTPIVRNSDLR